MDRNISETANARIMNFPGDKDDYLKVNFQFAGESFLGDVAL